MSRRCWLWSLALSLPLWCGIIALAQSTLPQFRGFWSAGQKCCTYYVDSAAANDLGNGLTPATAWKTVAKVNATTLTAGQSVGFKRGGTWRETLTPGQSGTAGKPITFAAYGSGAKPIISGADLVTSWTTETATAPLPAVLCAASAVATSVSCTGTITGSSDLVEVIAFRNNGEAITATDTKGNTLTPAGTQTMATGQAVTTYYTLHNNGSGVDTFSFSGVATTTRRIVVVEWAGIIASGGLDGSAFTASPASNTALSSGAASGSASNTTDLVIGALNSAGAPTPNAALTIMDTDSPGGTGFVVAYKLGAGNSAITGTQPTSARWSASVVTYVASATLPTVYYATYSVAPAQVFRDGVRLAKASAKANLAPGSWWLDAGNSRIYVYDDPANHVTEASQRDYNIRAHGKSYLAFSGLQAEGANSIGIYLEGVGTTGLALNDIAAYRSFGQGIVLIDYTSARATNILAAYNGSHGVDCNSTPGIVLDQITAHHNASLGNVVIAAGINLDVSGMTNATVQNSVTYQNGLGQAANVGYGVRLSYVGAGVVLKDNIAWGNNGAGIFMDGVSGASVVRNLAYNNLGGGISLGSAGGAVSGNLIYHNTAYGNTAEQMQISGPNTAASCVGNIVKNNLLISASGYALNAHYGAENDGTVGSGNVYLNNGLGPARANFIEWGVGTLKSTYATWETAYGSTTASIQADPLFTNAAGGDFTLQPGSPAIGAGVYIPGVSASNPPNVGAK